MTVLVLVRVTSGMSVQVVYVDVDELVMTDMFWAVATAEKRRAEMVENFIVTRLVEDGL